MTQQLPGVLQEIADVVGEADALAIAARTGGTRIYLPAQAMPGHWLAETIGLSQANKLCKHFAVDGKRGAQLVIPLHVGGTYRQFMRSVAERIHKLDEGDDESSSTIARKVGISQRTVHRHRARHRGDDDHGPKDDQGRPRQGKLL